VTALRVASLEASAPARRECGSEFRRLGPTEQKDRSPTAFSLKCEAARVGVLVIVALEMGHSCGVAPLGILDIEHYALSTLARKIFPYVLVDMTN